MKRWNKEVFEGIGKYKGPPVEIQVEGGDRHVVQQPTIRNHSGNILSRRF